MSARHSADAVRRDRLCANDIIMFTHRKANVSAILIISFIRRRAGSPARTTEIKCHDVDFVEMQYVATHQRAHRGTSATNSLYYIHLYESVPPLLSTSSEPCNIHKFHEFHNQIDYLMMTSFRVLNPLGQREIDVPM